MKDNNRCLLAWFVLALVALLAVMCWCIVRQEMQIADLREDIQAVESRAMEREMHLVRAETAAETPEKVDTDRQTPPENVSIVETDLADTAADDPITPDADETYVAAVVGDLEYVLRVLTAEGGSDDLMCGLVAQCLYNTCEKHGWTYTPAEMMRRYKYTSPATWVSAAAEKAYDEVFCSGVVYECVGNATVFYAPRYCGTSTFHESQRFVYEYGGVRFFEEVQG